MTTMDKAAPIGFMPLIRLGDLLFNAIVLQHRMFGDTRKTAIIEIRGSVGGNKRNLFGNDVSQVAARVFGDKRIAGELLLSNTMFGVFSRGISLRSSVVMGSQLLAGNAYSLRKAGLNSATTKLVSPRLRSCRACVEQDVSKQGWAAWRLLHQVAALDRCFEHGLALLDEAEPTGGVKNRRLWALRLPGESLGSRIAERECVPMSEGYASYLKIWPLLLKRGLQILRPRAWTEFVGGIVKQLGDRQGAVRVFEGEIRRNWDLEPSEIPKRLSMSGGDAFIRRELELNSRPSDLARRILVYSTAVRLGLVDDLSLEKSRQSEILYRCSQDDMRVTNSKAKAREKLADAVVDQGLPFALAQSLLNGVSSAIAAKSLKLSKETVRVFTARLPLQLLENLLKEQAWSDASWLKMELARRKQSNFRDSG